MHAMSHRSDYFLGCSSEFNILEPRFYQTITYHLIVTQVEISLIQYATAMWDTKSWNTLLLQVVISAQDEHQLKKFRSGRTQSVRVDVLR
jgi:hypothetical protein